MISFLRREWSEFEGSAVQPVVAAVNFPGRRPFADIALPDSVHVAVGPAGIGFLAVAQIDIVAFPPEEEPAGLLVAAVPGIGIDQETGRIFDFRERDDRPFSVPIRRPPDKGFRIVGVARRVIPAVLVAAFRAGGNSVKGCEIPAFIFHRGRIGEVEIGRNRRTGGHLERRQAPGKSIDLPVLDVIAEHHAAEQSLKPGAPFLQDDDAIAVVCVKRGGEHALLEVVFAAGSLGCAARVVQGRHQHGRQNRDDRDYHN